ncbi:Cyclic AMP response element-binding protein A [Eumeta japonica]|uniref:Cyclic AMP response element-binding protein A n=1 Tax=Eumeta variegata TaxID=151549 RepID=A0A4C2A945_EUMVA|nr:Cyclic AMP response element-binding protein A [Eumeta japonica]
MDDCASNGSSREGSQSPDICSDIEIDESCIKDEPMSPDSSCPSSPGIGGEESATINNANGTLSLTMANMAAFTNSDLVFEHKVSTPETKNKKIGNKLKAIVYRTRLYSNTSDGSEGNLSPEHMLSPQSPTSSTAAVTATSNMRSNLTANQRCYDSYLHQAQHQQFGLINYLQRKFHPSLGRHQRWRLTRQPIHTPLISSQPKGSTGTLLLTEEKTYSAEGYPIPQKLPLTKAEEKSLKKIRRKIKNKISAQESRRKKKEYMDQLERKVEVLVNENNDYKKRVKNLEDSNASLLSQLNKLQILVNKQNLKKS